MREPNGWKGIIAHGDGQMEIHPWECIEFENAGIYVYHNDKYETTTFLPIFTVREVRWHDAAKEKEGKNIGAKEMIGTREYQQRMQALRRERKELTE